MLLSANVRVIAVDGVLARGAPGPENADITLVWGTDLIDIQCKRPQSFQGFDQRVREARKQVEAKNRIGAIAIDCSAIIRPRGGMLRSASITEANSFIAKNLQSVSQSTLMKHRKNSILGFLLFARVPVMTKIVDSNIISHEGELFTYFQRKGSVVMYYSTIATRTIPICSGQFFSS
jgi:hypothetical protein